MIQISVRDSFADLPPSVLKKRIQEIESRNTWLDIFDDAKGDWTEEFKKLKGLEKGEGFNPNKISWVTQSSSRSPMAIRSEIPDSNSEYAPNKYNRFYHPKLDLIFVCVFDHLYADKEKIKKLLNILSSTPFEDLVRTPVAVDD